MREAMFFASTLGILVLIAWLRRRFPSGWASSASKLGLVLRTQPTLRLEGQRGQYQVGCYEAHELGYISVFARFPVALGLDFDFSLRRQGKLSKLFAVEDHEVGEPGFDDLVIVHGYRRQRIIAFLTEERRRAIRKFFENWTGKVDQDQVEVHFDGGIDDWPGIAAALESALELARALAERGAPGSSR